MDLSNTLSDQVWTSTKRRYAQPLERKLSFSSGSAALTNGLEAQIEISPRLDKYGFASWRSCTPSARNGGLIEHPNQSQ
jgi:hypothetical protein